MLITLTTPLRSASHPTGNPTLTDITCEDQEVQQLLSTHKTNTATGPDNISGHMLRNTATSIYQPLTQIFNFSLQSGSVPSQHGKQPMSLLFQRRKPFPNAPTIDQSLCSHCPQSYLNELLMAESGNSCQHTISFQTPNSASDRDPQLKKRYSL